MDDYALLLHNIELCGKNAGILSKIVEW